MSETVRREDPEALESFRELWQRAIEAGHLVEAEAIIQRALVWARGNGEARLVDSVVCALAAVAIHLGNGDGELPHLREILLRSDDPSNCLMAAYYLSIHYEFARNFKKSLFYARIASDRSQQLPGRADWIAYTHNQLGNALLGESFVDQACREYEQAVRLATDNGAWRARALNNLGYCQVLLQQFDAGYACLYESLRMLRRLSAERFQIMPRLDLCFAHLETGRYLHAHHQGAAALELAEKLGDVDAIKNALYLLGEASNLMGKTGAAKSYFTRLQRDYFPESPFLPGFLLAVDVRKMVNLHA
jgi:tetratricopeptide (TPR) repeat protein